MDVAYDPYVTEAEDPGLSGEAALETEGQLADRTQLLEAERWAQLVAVLDRPARENPGLANLFSVPSVFSPS
jgi:uncharacterized protein (DUF1778 family)